MHLKIDNLEIINNDGAVEVIKELFDLLKKNRYQNNLQFMKRSEFVFDYIYLLYYKCQKMNPNRGGSYIDSPDWIKNKKPAINSINKKDNNCFQYAITAALNHEEMKKDPQRITKIKPFINKHNWVGISLPSEKNDWKKFEKNNAAIALNVSYAKRYFLNMFKNITQTVQKQVILSMISNREKCETKSEERWHYLAVKKYQHY